MTGGGTDQWPRAHALESDCLCSNPRSTTAWLSLESGADYLTVWCLSPPISEMGMIMYLSHIGILSTVLGTSQMGKKCEPLSSWHPPTIVDEGEEELGGAPRTSPRHTWPPTGSSSVPEGEQSWEPCTLQGRRAAWLSRGHSPALQVSGEGPRPLWALNVPGRSGEGAPEHCLSPGRPSLPPSPKITVPPDSLPQTQR